MNKPSNPVTECTTKFNRLARENPTRSLLIAIGVGLAAGLLVRTLRPHTPESRAARLLTDIRDRLQTIAAPVQRHAGHLFESGSNAVSNGVAHLKDLELGSGLQKLSRRFTKLFR